MIIGLFDKTLKPKENSIKYLRYLMKENVNQRVYIQQNSINNVRKLWLTCNNSGKAWDLPK